MSVKINNISYFAGRLLLSLSLPHALSAEDSLCDNLSGFSRWLQCIHLRHLQIEEKFVYFILFFCYFAQLVGGAKTKKNAKVRDCFDIFSLKFVDLQIVWQFLNSCFLFFLWRIFACFVYIVRFARFICFARSFLPKCHKLLSTTSHTLACKLLLPPHLQKPKATTTTKELENSHPLCSTTDSIRRRIFFLMAIFRHFIVMQTRHEHKNKVK